MSFGPLQILLIVVVLVLLFGRGRISGLMGDVAKGIKSFKKGLSEEAAEEDSPPKSLDHQKSETVTDDKTSKKSE